MRTVRKVVGLGNNRRQHSVATAPQVGTETAICPCACSGRGPARSGISRRPTIEPDGTVALNRTKYRRIAAEAYLLLGRFDQASHEAETGYSLALDHGARAYKPALLRLRAHIALARGSDVEAMTHVDAGLQLAMALGLRAEEARLRLTHATLTKRRGESERAGAELERAQALVTALGMSVGG